MKHKHLYTLLEKPRIYKRNKIVGVFKWFQYQANKSKYNSSFIWVTYKAKQMCWGCRKIKTF